MSKADEAHLLTEKELAKLEKRIAKLYRDAAKEMQTTIDDYFSSFAKRDKEMQALIGSTVNGKEWTKENYKQWRLNQIGRGKRLEALRDKLAERVTQANETAVAYTNDTTPGIYSLNRNYTAYTIEQVSDAADFTLWDEQTVKRLAVERPDLMPYYPKKQALKRGIDLEYGKKQITASITSSILQGKSIKGIADDLQGRITTMSRASAIRTARTAVTGAQNAGRMDSYKAADDMGIKIEKKWVASKDNRTRHAHGAADGQIVPYDKPFKVDGYEMMYPGDRNAPGYLLYNCRCRMITANDTSLEAEPRQIRVRDPITGQWVVTNEMTYSEWAAQKEAENKTAWDVYMKKGRNLSSDSKQWEEYHSVLGNKVPNTLDSFQNLKYNSPETWKQLQKTKRQTVFVNNAPCETTKKKYSGYFLKEGAKHADQFFNVGYTAGDVLQLRYDMAKQFDMSKATNFSTNEKGQEKFRIYMELGVTEKKRFRTAWQKDTPDSLPRIITAFREDD